MIYEEILRKRFDTRTQILNCVRFNIFLNSIDKPLSMLCCLVLVKASWQAKWWHKYSC